MEGLVWTTPCVEVPQGQWTAPRAVPDKIKKQGPPETPKGHGPQIREGWPRKASLGCETFAAPVLAWLTAELLAFFSSVSYSPNLPLLPLHLIPELEAFLVLQGNPLAPQFGFVQSIFSPLISLGCGAPGGTQRWGALSQTLYQGTLGAQIHSRGDEPGLLG